MEKPEPKSIQEGQDKISKSLLADLENRTPEERLADLRRNASGSVEDRPQPKSIQAFQEDSRLAVLSSDQALARMTRAEKIAALRRNNSAASIYNPTRKT